MDAATFRKLGQVHGVGVVFENGKGDVLLLKRHPEAHQGGTYGLVGGAIEHGETPVLAAVREVREETGAKVLAVDLAFFRTYEWDFSHGHLTFEIFRSKRQYEGAVTLDAREHSGFLWDSPAALRKRNDLHPGVREVLADIYGADA